MQWSDESLKKNHGAHHRMSDEEMLERMSEVQSNRTESYLEFEDFRGIFDTKGQSTQLMKIPEEFLNML